MICTFLLFERNYWNKTTTKRYFMLIEREFLFLWELIRSKWTYVHKVLENTFFINYVQTNWLHKLYVRTNSILRLKETFTCWYFIQSSRAWTHVHIQSTNICTQIGFFNNATPRNFYLLTFQTKLKSTIPSNSWYHFYQRWVHIFLC